MFKLRFVPPAFLSLALAGCGGPDVEKVVGRVLLAGRPEARLSVCLWPTSDLNNGVLVDPQTDAEGVFEIHPDPKQGQKGNAGTYTLLVHDPVYPPRFDKKFFSPETSPWQVEIGKGVTELTDFDLPAWDKQKQISAQIHRLMSRIHE